MPPRPSSPRTSYRRARIVLISEGLRWRWWSLVERKSVGGAPPGRRSDSGSRLLDVDLTRDRGVDGERRLSQRGYERGDLLLDANVRARDDAEARQARQAVALSGHDVHDAALRAG